MISAAIIERILKKSENSLKEDLNKFEAMSVRIPEDPWRNFLKNLLRISKEISKRMPEKIPK